LNRFAVMMAGGLSWSDVGSAERAKLFGGLAREVFERIGKHYGQDPATVFDIVAPEAAGRSRSGVDFIRPPSLAFEPKVAERVFNGLAREAGVRVVLDSRARTVAKEGARIAKAHEDYLRGLFHFLRTDPRVPAHVREETARFGLPKDEFIDTGHWPHRLYVREARRMVSDFVMTEHHILNQRVAPDGIALATPGQLNPDLLLRALCERRHFVSFFNDLQAAADHPAMPAAQHFATKGFFASYDANLDEPRRPLTSAPLGLQPPRSRSGVLRLPLQSIFASREDVKP